MPKRGRKRKDNPTEHTIYMRGYRAGQKRDSRKRIDIFDYAMEGIRMSLLGEAVWFFPSPHFYITKLME